MVGQIDISPDGSCLLISFPYRADLVEVVKSIPGRRWDRGSRTWKVPVAEVERCVRTFMAHGFRLSPDVATALATGGESKDLGTMQLAGVDQAAPALTVSALNLRVAEVLSQNFQQHLWVVGEVQSFKAKGRSRHRYFELVERDETELDAPPRAVVEAVIFDSAMPIVNKRLRSAAQQFTLEDGLKVRVRGRVDLYQPRGRYQFVIDDIDPNYTLGDLYLRREKILRELEKLGLLEKNLSLEVPRVPLRVALLTSFESEAYNDFVKTLANSRFSFDVTVYDVFVQGERLQASVLEALSAFRSVKEDFDVLVITRGGGSRSELGSWDDLEVAKAVAEHPLKAIIGIGHERDQSVLDSIATSVKTPTAAAEMLVERVRAYQEQVEDAMLEIADRAQRMLRDERRDLRRQGLQLKHSVRAGLAGAVGTVRAARDRLGRGVARLVRDATRGLRRRAAELERDVFRRFAREQFALQQTAARLVAGSAHRLTRTGEHLEMYRARARSVDPVQVLGRGFAIVRNRRGQALRSVHDTRQGESLTAQLTDGRLGVTVDSVTQVETRAPGGESDGRRT